MPKKGKKKNTKLNNFLDIEEHIPKLSKKYFKRPFILVYGIENNLNNRDKKIHTNSKNMTALEAITETIRDLTFINHTNSYKNHLDFIKFSLSNYTEYNKGGGRLELIRTHFFKMKEDVKILEGILKTRNYTKDILDLFTEFYKENANNQTIKEFITNNYYGLTGIKKTNDNKNSLDLGIDVTRGKITIPENLESGKYPFYLENLIEAMKYRYLIEKDKYDEYIYYMSKIAEIYKEIEIDKIAQYEWEEKALVTQLMKLYNIDIKSAIKYIDVKESKQRGETKDDKRVKRDSKIKEKIKELSNSVDKFGELIKLEEQTKRILTDKDLETLNGNLKKLKEILKNYQDGTEVVNPLDVLEDLDLRSSGPEPVVEAPTRMLGQPQTQQETVTPIQDPKSQRYAGNSGLQSGGVLPTRKRTPIKRR